MKIKGFILALLTGIIALNGCNDEWSSVGASIQDKGNKINVQTDTFTFEATTIQLDSIYARTTTGLLGEVYDPVYGKLQSDYICQFYCPDGFTFFHEPMDKLIDSVDFRIYYSAWVGDSLAPMRVQVYQVDKPLDKKYYTNINPKTYCDMDTVWGSQTYTAYDRSIPDSVRSADSFYPYIRVRLPKQWGQGLYEKTPFESQAAFNEFFSGLYITTTFGSGNIISVDGSYISIYYHYDYTATSSEGTDSIVTVNTMETFSVTNEVIQLNRFENTDVEDLLAENDSFTYLKTPLGIATSISIPTKDIKEAVSGGRIISNIPLDLAAMPPATHEYAWGVPPYVLLLPKDSLETFFTGSRTEDNITSFLFGYQASTLSYRAYSATSTGSASYATMNLANLLKEHLKNASGEDLHLLLLPVSRETTSDYYGTVYTSSLSHYLYPSGITLRKDTAKRQFVVISSQYGEK